MKSRSASDSRCVASSPMASPRDRQPIRLAAAWVVAMVALIVGCHAARVLAPPPGLRAASASDFVVDVEFDEPLDRASAEDMTHYDLHPVSDPGSVVEILSVALVDTTFGRVVQLLIPSGLPDGVEFEVRSHDVLSLQQRSTGTRAATFHTGLSYAMPLRDLFAAHCDRCHGPAQADGNYRTDTLAGLLAGGSDATPNLVAGDPNCTLVRRTRPLRTMFDRGGLTYLDFEIIRNWVLSYAARQ